MELDSIKDLVKCQKKREDNMEDCIANNKLIQSRSNKHLTNNYKI